MSSSSNNKETSQPDMTPAEALSNWYVVKFSFCSYYSLLNESSTHFSMLSLSILYFHTSLLSQYTFCLGGVLGGAAYGIKAKKGLVPMVVAGVAGTMSDLVYGYMEACKDEVDSYQRNTGNSNN